MPPFKYRVITANCGNDTIGDQASQEIVELIEKDKAHFYVIHCQEVDFDKTMKQLESSINNKEYQVKCLGRMATHTKWDTQLYSRTGIATFIIYHHDLKINEEHKEKIRRIKNRLIGGSGYNKGGLFTDFKITEGDKSIKIHTLNGHLDSNKAVQRNKEWHLLNQKISIPRVSDWQELQAAYPHLVLSGYDLNTRNKLIEGKETNMWEHPKRHPEIDSFNRTAGRKFSVPNTYDHSQEGKERDLAREDYFLRGMMDRVDIADGSVISKKVLQKEVIKIEPNIENSKRDHSIIISPNQDYNPPDSDFNVVKGQMASRLDHVAPALAKIIRKMDENPETKADLVKIHNEYLSPNGFVNQAILLHAKKLECVQHLMAYSFIKDDQQMQDRISNMFFKRLAWCQGPKDKIKKRQELMDVLLNSLKYCDEEEGIKARLDCYDHLAEQIKAGKDIEPKEQFKILAIQDYCKLREHFEKHLKHNEQDTRIHRQFKELGIKVLNHVDAIAADDAMKSINILHTLTRIMKACSTLLEIWNNPLQKIKIPEAISRLEALIQKVTHHSSQLWHSLAQSLDVFTHFASEKTKESSCKGFFDHTTPRYPDEDKNNEVEQPEP
jgi:hypothetical protein